MFLSGITVNSVLSILFLISVIFSVSFLITKKLIKKTRFYKTKIKDKGDFLEFIFYLSIMVFSLLILALVIYLIYLSFLYD